jgi:NedA-like, galactose-binding domain
MQRSHIASSGSSVVLSVHSLTRANRRYGPLILLLFLLGMAPLLPNAAGEVHAQSQTDYFLNRAAAAPCSRSGYGPNLAVDGNNSTKFIVDPGCSSNEITIDTGAPTSITSIAVNQGTPSDTDWAIMGTPPPPPPPDDVFMGKRAWDGNECFGGCAYMAGNATDGNEATIWGARSNSWRVDLTAPTNIGSIRLYQEGNYATTIDILAGNQVGCNQWGICDMSDAQTITASVTLTNGWNTVSVPGDTAYRMYQIVATTQSGTGQWSVSSIQGFALPAPPQHTTSYYVQSPDPAVARTLGCQARQRGERGVVVLDLGGPYIRSVSSPPGVEYGARLAHRHVCIPRFSSVNCTRIRAGLYIRCCFRVPGR